MQTAGVAQRRLSFRVLRVVVTMDAAASAAMPAAVLIAIPLHVLLGTPVIVVGLLAIGYAIFLGASGAVIAGVLVAAMVRGEGEVAEIAGFILDRPAHGDDCALPGLPGLRIRGQESARAGLGAGPAESPLGAGQHAGRLSGPERGDRRQPGRRGLLRQPGQPRPEQDEQVADQVAVQA